jgi:hypothetical protein
VKGLYSILIVALVISAAPASPISPFVHGGYDRIAPGSWTVTNKVEETLVPRYYGNTFYLGGGFTFDVKKFRQKRIVPTLSLDTCVGFTYFRHESTTEELGKWEQTFSELTVTEALVCRLKIPAGSRLVTPFIGVGGGFGVAPTSINKLDNEEEGYYNASATAFTGVWEVPFGLEVTLTPTSTIYWRFGPVVPIGKATMEYETGRRGGRARERVESEIPNSFVVLFGYRWGQ